MSESYVPDLSGRVGVRMTVAILGTIAGLASMIVVLIIMAWTNADYAPLKSTVVTTPEKIEALKDLQARDQKTLQSYGADPVTGVQRIPIDVAMEKVVADYQK